MIEMPQEIKLRPHHGLCIQFFEGKGYDEAFTLNMTQIIAQLETENNLINLTPDCDVLCAACPNNMGGVCTDNEKVASIDKRTLNTSGLDIFRKILWSEYKKLLKDEIIETGRLKEVCRNCCWSRICLVKGSEQLRSN